MNTNTSFIKKIAVIAGLALGAFSLSAIADWAPPVSTPPTCLSGNPGCDAPINAGPLTQQKKMVPGGGNKLVLGAGDYPAGPELLKVLGGIVSDEVVTRAISIKGDGAANTPGNGKVLTSDASGYGTWATSTSGAIPTKLTPTTVSGTWTAPAGVTRVRIRAWGGGGGGAGYDDDPQRRVGGGGGGGGYAEGLVTVTPGSIYTISIGGGGYPGIASGTGPERCGTNGGDTTFSLGTTKLITARGGEKGYSNCGTHTDYAGGVGGAYDIYNNANAFGMNGGAGAKGAGSTQQSEGGDASMGGHGTSAWIASVPTLPGGGGGGGVITSLNRVGFPGAKGMLIVEY